MYSVMDLNKVWGSSILCSTKFFLVGLNEIGIEKLPHALRAAIVMTFNFKREDQVGHMSCPVFKENMLLVGHRKRASGEQNNLYSRSSNPGRPRKCCGPVHVEWSCTSTFQCSWRNA